MRIVILMTIFWLPSVWGAPSASVKHSLNRAETAGKAAETLVLPYAFSTESMGLNIGIGGMASGYYQEQMTAGLTAYGGEVSRAVGGGIWNYRLPGTDRLYFSIYGMSGYYPDQRAYSATRQDYVPAGQPMPGGNDSSVDDFIQADGVSNWWSMKLEFSLPIGATREQGVVHYETRNGLLTSEPSGGDQWNPLASGSSVLVLKQFNRYQSFEQQGRTLDGAVHAVEFGLLYDNTDFSVNPSKGSRQYIAVTHDAGWLESDQKWTVVEFEASKYFSFGESGYAHQRILALNFWTAYSPTWQLNYNEDGGRIVDGGAPYNEGATLGGFYRMRGYDQNRFHDKASIYGAAEYRYTLKYNPIRNIEWLRFVKLDWFQLVGFVEAGRVAPQYTVNALLSDVKTDAGISLRAMTAGIVVRSDVAYSDEGGNLWLMVDHPF
ncbi:hypothetical protein SIN8267_01941 [Sinobacterium norvegicum]|uniref:Bacterial surface antigen (D15) domain-containing protein n=1 Tax=Sinobacterium norvegicum TaxID=1641715 RepID=A0ABN8ENT5_9GAMM|nr:BamA/TamA family outer membrane protein [Sinobacterium norvegicum]CAH0991826.1 hypothetical protein SIN8267_01941 [Sinobacterium norvegicum]